jgi:hypothetical protein
MVSYSRPLLLCTVISGTCSTPSNSSTPQARSWPPRRIPACKVRWLRRRSPGPRPIRIQDRCARPRQDRRSLREPCRSFSPTPFGVTFERSNRTTPFWSSTRTFCPKAAQLALSSFKHVCAIFAPCPGLSGVSPQNFLKTVPAGYWGSPHVASGKPLHLLSSTPW